MLIDEVRVLIKAGNGGDGMVHFYSDAWRPKGGPDGGDGGDGGDVIFEGVTDISKLNQFRHKKTYSAQNGQPGGRNKRSGKKGDDLIIQVPVGTVVTYDNGSSVEFTDVGQRILMARGGSGGKGNFQFRSATNQTPEEFQPGFKTEAKSLFIELKLIAQLGLIGLPNAGKTSLLNELTSAQARVANYAFTTLEPNLGATKGGLIIADIPGLIEGAAQGKGLGVKFLRHIERTKLLIHCIAADTTDAIVDYQTIRKELENYSTKLANKTELVVITKSDLVDAKIVEKIQSQLNAHLVTSIIDDQSIKKLSDLITQKIKELSKPNI